MGICDTACILSCIEWSVHYYNSTALHTAPLAADKYHLVFMHLYTSFIITTASLLML